MSDDTKTVSRTGNRDAAISYSPLLGEVRELSISSISSAMEERVGPLFLSLFLLPSSSLAPFFGLE